MAHAVITLGQIDQAELGEVLKELLADLAVRHFVSFLSVVKQEGQVKDLGGLIEGGEAGGAGKDDVDGAHTGGLDGLGVVAQLVGVVDVQGDGAVGSFAYQAGILNNGLGGNRVLVAGGVNGQGYRLDAGLFGRSFLSGGLGCGSFCSGGLGCAASGAQGKNHAQCKKKRNQFFHVFSSIFFLMYAGEIV